MKKIHFLLAIVLIVLLMVTGCGGKDNTNAVEKPVDDKPAAQQEKPADDKPAISQVEPSKPATSTLSPKDSVKEIFRKAQGLEYYYEYTVDSTDGKMEGKLWTKGKNMRVEINVDGMESIIIFNLDKGEAYNYIPAEKMAIKLDMNTLVNMYQDPDELIDDDKLDEIKTVEYITYQGMKCVVFTTEDDEGTKSKLWISEQYGIPLRVEEVEADGHTTVVEYKNLKVGPQPGNLFELPAGVKIMKF